MSFSIRLTDTERQLAMAYAQMHSLTMSEAFKKALFDKIEDEYDFEIEFTMKDIVSLQS